MIIQLDNPIIAELPFTWRMALTQGNTNVIATPSPSQLQNIEQLAKELIPLIALIGQCTVNSWLRTPLHNREVGGAPSSAHLLGAAIDLHPLNNSVEKCKVLLRTINPRKLFCEINTTNWLHVDHMHDHDFIA